MRYWIYTYIAYTIHCLQEQKNASWTASTIFLLHFCMNMTREHNFKIKQFYFSWNLFGLKQFQHRLTLKISHFSHKHIRILLLMNVLWWLSQKELVRRQWMNSFVKQFNFPIVDGCEHADTHTHTYTVGITCHEITCSTYIFIVLMDFHIALVPFSYHVQHTHQLNNCIPHAKCEWNQLNTRADTHTAHKALAILAEGTNEM